MTLTGILVLTTPAALANVIRAIAALEWAEVHPSDGSGRLVVTVEAETTEASLERLKALKRLPGVLSAEMMIHCCEDESPAAAPDAGGAPVEDLLNQEDETPGSYYRGLKALSNF
jgi:nitrate reductase NapAB chaperone NapD